MEKNIQKILEDIYMIDEELKGHEKELKKVITELIEARPEAEIDDNFLQELRSEVIRRAGELKIGQKEDIKREGIFSFGKLAYAFGGAALVLIIVIPFLNKQDMFFEKSQVADNSVAPKLNEVSIAKRGDKAFGILGGDNSEKSIARTQSSGGGGGIPAPMAEMGGDALGLGGGAIMNDSAKMIAPDFINYEYVYAGDEIPAVDGQLEVFKKVKNKVAQSDFAQSIANLDFGVLDLSKFRNTDISNFNLVEDREFGYSIYFNLAESQFSIGTNWQKWPRPDENCRDQACFDQFRLKISDVPVDSELIAIADRFLRDYDIDMKNYGQGEVLDYWRRSYEEAEDKNNAWIPDTIPVVYPLMINGEAVYDEAGNKTGIMVEVNIRHNKVAGLNNVMAQAYESSNYEAETDIEMIKKVAENGGRYNRYYYGEPESGEKAIIELGTPKLGLVQYWNYDEEKNESSELYVPSYIFPVTSKPEGVYYYQETVVVPLIKDLLKDFGKDIIDPMPRPMPLMEPGMGGATSDLAPDEMEIESVDAVMTR